MDKKKHPKKGKKLRLAVDVDCTSLLASGVLKNAHITSVVNLTGSARAEDKFIYAMANQKDYHIVTYNLSDFSQFPKSSLGKSGVIGIVQGSEKAKTRLKEFVDTHRHEDLKKKVFVISERSTREM
jgi:hypothetical protein